MLGNSILVVGLGVFGGTEVMLRCLKKLLCMCNCCENGEASIGLQSDSWCYEDETESITHARMRELYIQTASIGEAATIEAMDNSIIREQYGGFVE
jgi:hypothetical protein